MSQFHRLAIASITTETRDAIVVTFAVPPALREAFAFTQGQHLTVRAQIDSVEVRRSYSICAAPQEHVLRIAIKKVQDGAFSTWAHTHLQAGATIECMPPAGSFHAPLDASRQRHHLAFAAGSGITPVLSIAKATLHAEPLSRFTLVYGNRSSSSVIFREELGNLKDRYLDRLNVVHILSREQQDIELFNGRIDGPRCDALLERWIGADDIDMAYLCGPQSMMEAVSASLQRHGVTGDRIRTELFGTAPAHVARPKEITVTGVEKVCRVTVVQDGRRREFTTRRDGSTLLDAALAQGMELPYSCKGGVCSTCRTKLTAGQVEMDGNFALEDYEVARGFILTCQSYPLTAEIELDFDRES